MICPQETNKQYIIPTKKWLKPIEKYITYDVNTEGLIMLGKFIDKEEVIVKITKDKRYDIIEINKLIKDLPNFAETYCSFSCLENFDSLFNEYKDSKSFCNAKDDNKVITLEIMKKYKNGSLFKLQNKLNIEQVVNIMKQLMLAQMHAYSKTGLLHNDMHLGNVLIHKSKKLIQIKYEIQTDSHIKTEINISSDFIPIISDFNEASIYKKDHDLKLLEFRKQFTLCKNINDTFNQCLLLLKEKYYISIIKLIHTKTYEINKYLGTSTKNLRSYYKKYYNYEDSKKRECINALAFSSFLISFLDEHSTDNWFDL
jgi:RIO-like serine/threonine protein kinase